MNDKPLITKRAYVSKHGAPGGADLLCQGVDRGSATAAKAAHDGVLSGANIHFSWLPSNSASFWHHWILRNNRLREQEDFELAAHILNLLRLERALTRIEGVAMSSRDGKKEDQ
jgi:hypothetical protein